MFVCVVFNETIVKALCAFFAVLRSTDVQRQLICMSYDNKKVKAIVSDCRRRGHLPRAKHNLFLKIYANMNSLQNVII